MDLTNVFDRNLKAYNDNYRLIINQGSTRSSKTYSILQLLLLIAKHSKKPLVISIVSYALPHLRLGAIREFEKILIDYGIVPDKVRNKTENTYIIGKSIIEFFGVDNLAKVHGPERDILYINEGNYIKSYEIVSQLLIRTRQTAFIDFNPSREFWYHEEIEGKRDYKFIHSTYKDNKYLTLAQINEIESRKNNEQWWKVYGLGELGQLEDAILTNWEFGEFDESLPYGYGLDYGSRHPDAMTKVAIDRNNKKIYIKEEIYKNGLSTGQLYEMIESREVGKSLIVAEYATGGIRTNADLRIRGLNVIECNKGRIIDDIKLLRDYKLIITPDSYNLQKNLNNWVWLDKKGEIPIDVDDDLIDSFRYYCRYVLVPVKKRTQRVLI